jgi:hypothetical protein
MVASGCSGVPADASLPKPVATKTEASFIFACTPEQLSPAGDDPGPIVFPQPPAATIMAAALIPITIRLRLLPI